MEILRVDIVRNFLRRMMVHTRASEATSSSVAYQQPRRAPLQEAQDPESEPSSSSSSSNSLMNSNKTEIFI
jgi:hypothetical protein